MPLMPLALRSPSFLPQSFTTVLFESHFLYYIALLLLGAVLIIVARNRQNPRLLRAGQILSALTLLWALAARFIDTPAERLYNAHLQLAAAAEKHDVDAILAFCEPKFSIDSINIHPDTADAKKTIKSTLDQFAIKETTFTRYEFTLNLDGTAVSRFSAFTKAEPYSLPTTWQVSWDDLPGDDWKLRNATLLKIGDQVVSPGAIMP